MKPSVSLIESNTPAEMFFLVFFVVAEVYIPATKNLFMEIIVHYKRYHLVL